MLHQWHSRICAALYGHFSFRPPWPLGNIVGYAQTLSSLPRAPQAPSLGGGIELSLVAVIYFHECSLPRSVVQCNI